MDLTFYMAIDYFVKSNKGHLFNKNNHLKKAQRVYKYSKINETIQLN